MLMSLITAIDSTNTQVGKQKFSFITLQGIYGDGGRVVIITIIYQYYLLKRQCIYSINFRVNAISWNLL